MHARSRRRRRGATLVELVGTTAFVAVALVATAAAVIEAADLTRSNTQTRAACAALTTLLEEVRGTRFSDVDTRWGGATRTVTSIPDAPGGARAAFEVTDVPTGNTRWQVRRVEVTLSWGGRDVSAVTYVSDRDASSPPGGGG